MAEYKSNYTGEQIDGGIERAYDAISNVQNVDESGTNGTIKITKNRSGGGVTVTYVKPKGLDNAAYKDVDTEITTNSTSQNLPTSEAVANFVNGQGGGGGASIRVVDATNPEDWEGEGPSQSCLLDILTNVYQVIYIDNVPTEEEGMDAGLTMYLLSKVDMEGDGSEAYIKQYVRFDDGDGEDPTVQTFTFTKEGDDDAEMEVASYELNDSGGGGDAPIWIHSLSSYISGTTGETEFTIYSDKLSELSDAIDNDNEAVLRVNGSNYDDNRFFRVSAYDRNGRTYIQDWDESVYFPDFVCETKYGRYYAEFDHVEPSLNYAVYVIREGSTRYTPTTVDAASKIITFDIDDESEIWSQHRLEFTVNVDENSGVNWVAFKKTSEDLTAGNEYSIYSSNIIFESSSAYVYEIVFKNSGGSISTEYYKYEISLTAPNV